MDWSSASECYTRFDDLSNEVIYEIFEYLDFYHLYQTFSTLNSRYYDLIHHSTVQIDLILPSIPQRGFQNFSKDFLIINQHRIRSIYSTNPFLFDVSPSPFRYLFQFRQLHTLFLEQFDSKHLQNLFSQITVLPYLTSLTIKPLNAITNKDHLYQQIFRLPALIYCQVACNEPWSNQWLTICRNQYSTIKHLVIAHPCSLNDLMITLTYVPQLRRLSCEYLRQPSITQRSNFHSIVLSQLTHLSFGMRDVSFDQFESFLTKISHDIQVVQLSTESSFQLTYIDGQRWENFILNYLPKLRLFDLDVRETNHTNMPLSMVLINRFLTSFWLQRQWFFRYEYNHQSEVFYSIQPYRKNSYNLNENISRETRSIVQTNHLPSVTHLSIDGDISLQNEKSIHFPNVTQLTLNHYSNRSLHSISMILDRLMSLNRLSKVSLSCSQFCISQLMDLLYFSPNIRMLVLKSISLSKISLNQIRLSQTYQTIHKVNQINQVTLGEESNFDAIELFYQLCPRLEQFNINVSQHTDSNIRNNLGQLFASHYVPVLCLLQADPAWHAMFRRDPLQDDRIKMIDTCLFLWS